MRFAALPGGGREPRGFADRDNPCATVRTAVDALRELVADATISELSDAGLIDLLQELRRLRSIPAAGEACAMSAFSSQQQHAATERGVPTRDRRKGIADQIALAVGVGPHTAANRLVMAERLCAELPLTFERLASGAASEAAAYAVARESVCLLPEQAAVLDAKVAPRLRRRTGPRAAASIARAEAARSRGQLMADELFTRLTGAADPGRVPVEIQLVMPASALDSPTGATDASLPIRDGQELVPLGGHPGRIGDHPLPPEVCRDIALDPRDEAERFIRRIFADPVSGDVRAVDERRRFFSGATRRAIIARDQQCRQCSAPIRHIDHVKAYAVGGGTSMSNAQGLCARCNLTKDLPGWRSRAMSIDGRHVVVTTTPTGHRYTSLAPPPLLSAPDQDSLPRRPTSVEGTLNQIPLRRSR